jgi:hypothetical protein
MMRNRGNLDNAAKPILGDINRPQERGKFSWRDDNLGNFFPGHIFKNEFRARAAFSVGKMADVQAVLRPAIFPLNQFVNSGHGNSLLVENK